MAEDELMARVQGFDIALEPTIDGCLDLATESGDLALCSGLDNLVQALAVRLNSIRGDLAPLGHPAYGSRLHELIGRLNDQSTRDLVKFYAVDCIRQDPRIEEILAALVESSPEPGRLDVSVTVRAAESHRIESLVFPFYLDVP